MAKFNHQPVQLQYDITAKSTEAGRLYSTPDGNWYPSVTNFLSHFTNGAIQEWKKAVGEEEARRVGRHAATRGTFVHDTAEDYLNNVENYDRRIIMPHVQQMWNSLKRMLDDSVDNIRMQECPLYSDKLLLAGRVDLIAEYDNKLSIVDFKTSSRPKSADQIENYFLQTCAYSMMFEERTGIKIDQLVILMVIEGSNDSQVFKEQRCDWEDKLLRKRDKYYEFLRKNIISD